MFQMDTIYVKSNGFNGKAMYSYSREDTPLVRNAKRCSRHKRDAANQMMKSTQIRRHLHAVNG